VASRSAAAACASAVVPRYPEAVAMWTERRSRWTRLSTWKDSDRSANPARN